MEQRLYVHTPLRSVRHIAESFPASRKNKHETNERRNQKIN